MNMNPLPPQAYTKEQLVKAYQWLQSQPDNIKELATNPDILVSLYLKAKMNGDSCLDRPSIQNFKNELKNLAGIMGEFDVMDQNQVAALSQPPPLAPPVASFQQPQATAQMNAPSPAAAQASLGQHMGQQNVAPMNFESLDYKTQCMIREVKNEMNLSSDAEAIRLLIAVGYKKLKSI